MGIAAIGGLIIVYFIVLFLVYKIFEKLFKMVFMIGTALVIAAIFYLTYKGI